MSEPAVSAVPVTIHKNLFAPVVQLIPPGESIESREIDVGGAQHIAVNVSIGDHGASVECEILFVHRLPHAGVGAAHVHTERMEPGDEAVSHLNAFLPVHTPALLVRLTNVGNKPARTFHCWVYGIRIAPSTFVPPPEPPS